MKIPLRKHQKEAVEKVLRVFEKKECAYLFGSPRVGKSLIACEVSVRLQKKKVLVLTKKQAINGWVIFTKEYPDIEVINYERIEKMNPDDYDFIIIDEAHNFSAFPRWTQRIKSVKKFCYKKQILFLSGTPVVEGSYRLYSQFSLSSSSPFWKWTNPYKFFKEFGKPHIIQLYGRHIEKYDTFDNEKILALAEDWLVRVTLEDAGFNYKNEDLTVYIENQLAEVHDYINKTCYIAEDYETEEYPSGKSWIQPVGNSYPLENVSAKKQALHRLCGGFYNDLDLPQPKLEWLRQFVKDHKGSKIAVMCYFKEEQENVPKIIGDGIDVYSSTKYCEGIDLSHYDHLILYSFGYSGAKFVQLRDRIVNINKERDTNVIIPLLADCIDDWIYAAVSQKKDFNNDLLLERFNGRRI